MNKLYGFSTPFVVPFDDNDFDTNNRAYVPEVWAQESLMVLEENMVMANLVHRDFENEIAAYGDVVNTRQPGTFEAKRKTAADDVTIQAATADKVQVPLDQYFHTSFLIRDEEMSKSFKDLVAEFLTPAVQSIAQGIDQVLCGQVYQFMHTNRVGKLGTDPTKAIVISANTLMNQNKVPTGPGMRNFVLTPGAEGALLNVSEFTKVNEAADGGSALEQARLTSKFGFDFYMSQNMPSIAAQTSTVETATINNSDGYAKGTTSLTITGTSETFVAGQWFTVGGDMTPQVIVTASSTPTTSITCYPGLNNAVEHGATVTVYPIGAVNYSDGYDKGYTKALAIDGFTAAPAVGQLVSTESGDDRVDYAAIGTPTTTSMFLDRAVSTALTNDDVIGLGPSGDFSFAFHRNALALVTRPLALAPAGLGASQAVVNYNGLSIRVSLQYLGQSQGILVTVDTLCGVKVLNTALGVAMFG